MPDSFGENYQSRCQGLQKLQGGENSNFSDAETSSKSNPGLLFPVRGFPKPVWSHFSAATVAPDLNFPSKV